MNDDQRADQEQPEAYRSLSGTIIQGAFATGAVAYGTGQLAEGIAKLHDSFSGGNEQPQQSAPAEPTSKEPPA